MRPFTQTHVLYSNVRFQGGSWSLVWVCWPGRHPRSRLQCSMWASGPLGGRVEHPYGFIHLFQRTSLRQRDLSHAYPTDCELAGTGSRVHRSYSGQVWVSEQIRWYYCSLWVFFLLQLGLRSTGVVCSIKMFLLITLIPIKYNSVPENVIR